MNDRAFQSAFDALTKALQKGDHLAGFSLTERDEIASALVDAISPALHKDLHERLDRQTRAIEWIRTIAGGGDRLPSEWADPWRKRAEQAETELAAAEDLADRRLQDHRAEIAEAEAQIRTAEAERDRLKAAIGPAVNHDEPCGNREPADGQLTCTLREGHLTHYAAGSGTAWACICAPTADQAALARVKALAEDMRTWCSPHGIAVTYAQRIEEAINPPELAAVREFATKHDPREEST